MQHAGMHNNNNNNSTGKSRKELYILGVDIGGFSPLVQVFILGGGVFLFYLLYGYLQEDITTKWKKEKISLAWFLTSTQCLIYSLFTFIGRYAMHDSSATAAAASSSSPNQAKQKKAKLQSFALIGFLATLTIGMSNLAIAYLSYPTQTAFKSSKPIPVMIMGIFILGKRYRLIDYLSVICLTIGLVLFTLGDAIKVEESNFNIIGVGTIIIALLVDGVIGNVQQKLFNDFDVSPSDMVMKKNLFAGSFSFLVALFSGQVLRAFYFYSENVSDLRSILVYSLTGALGWF